METTNLTKEINLLIRDRERLIVMIDKIAGLMNRYGLDIENAEEDFDEKIIEFIEGLKNKADVR